LIQTGDDHADPSIVDLRAPMFSPRDGRSEQALAAGALTASQGGDAMKNVFLRTTTVVGSLAALVAVSGAGVKWCLFVVSHVLGL
jgi:hypothetical protein